MSVTTQLRDRRTVLAGAAGLGLAAVAGATLTRAQSTPETTEPTDDTTTTDTAMTDRAAERAERYQDFVSRLATELGSDATTVDAGIRAALTGIVDDTYAAGEISANDAEAARTAIAEADAPIAGLVMGLRGDRGGRGPGGGFGGAGRAVGEPGVPSDSTTTDGTTDGTTDDSTVDTGATPAATA